jgi:hypothetical protein
MAKAYKMKELETYSIDEFTVNEGKDLLRVCIRTNTSVFIWGPPGCGKSWSVQNIATEIDREMKLAKLKKTTNISSMESLELNSLLSEMPTEYHFIDIRLSQLSELDLRGMPTVAKDRNDKSVLTWTVPDFMPTDPDFKGIMFFDEMNHANDANLKASYQLMQDRKLGNYTLPKGVSIVAAGNRKNDHGNVFELPAPLANRFTHVTVKPEYHEWQSWAISARVNPSIIGYIEAKPHNLFSQDEVGKNMAFATGRSWARLSTLMEATNDLTLINRLAIGNIGVAMANEFMAYLEEVTKLPNPEDVLTGKITEFKETRPDLNYSLSMTLLYKIKEDDEKRQKKKMTQAEFDTRAETFFKFVLNGMKQSDGIKTMIVRKSYVDFGLKFNWTKVSSLYEYQKKYGAIIAEVSKELSQQKAA